MRILLVLTLVLVACGCRVVRPINITINNESSDTQADQTTTTEQGKEVGVDTNATLPVVP